MAVDPSKDHRANYDYTGGDIHRSDLVEELEELMPGATLVTCSGFGDAIIDCM